MTTLFAAWLGGGTASAGEWRDPKPYVLPVINLSAISVNGEWYAIASAGAMGGVRIRYSEVPHWVSNTRALLVGMYGIPSGSLGAEGRLGSFIGPDFKLLNWQAGPDFFYNGYGNPDAIDYWSPWAPGLDLHNVVTLKLVDELQVVGEATPGWVFHPQRKQLPGLPAGSYVDPFDQLSLAAMLVIRAPFARLTVGYSRQYSNVGVIEGIILSGAL